LPNYGKILIDKNICYFETEKGKMCYNIYALPITIRNRKDGDKILVKNKLRNLSDFLTNNKVSHFERNNSLVIVDQEGRVINLIKKN
jgi:tRNA(Ile)-lysidine synthetase-like protein